MAERKFRDGKREVPDYIDTLMGSLETERLTYDDALDAMNREMLGQHIDRAVTRQIDRHFRENPPR